MLLEGGLKWQAMSLTPADMDFAGLKAAAAREIALAFGVPPMLLGLPGRFDLRQLSRGEPGAVAADGAAAGRQDCWAAIARALGAWWPGLSSGSTSTG